jgi:predicted nuclease of predicted toxin-antitoxin system
VKLVLDEHFSFRLAEQLRKKGCDVIAAVERPELREMSDEALLRWASRNDRPLVTQNVQDFLPIHAEFLNHGDQHCGLILTSARKFPRSAAASGRSSLRSRRCSVSIRGRPGFSSTCSGLISQGPTPAPSTDA